MAVPWYSLPLCHPERRRSRSRRIFALTGCESQANGLLSGDILLSANGQSLTHCSQLHRLLLETQPGDSISLEVFRAGRRFTVELPVTQQP